MKKLILATLSTALTVLCIAGVAGATGYEVESFDSNQHSLWIPGLDQRNIHFDDGAILDIGPDQWTLSGTLTSAKDGSKWSIQASFGSVLTGEEFYKLTDADDSRIKGNSWANLAANWAFAEDVSGTLTQLSGVEAGTSYVLSRYAGTNDYYAQFGTGMNDKDKGLGFSTWIELSQVSPFGNMTGKVYRADLNLSANPVPEPSAALVFGAGMLVVATSFRRRRLL